MLQLTPCFLPKTDLEKGIVGGGGRTAEGLGCFGGLVWHKNLEIDLFFRGNFGPDDEKQILTGLVCGRNEVLCLVVLKN